ncbi:hypothetical protein A4R44_01343 [Amycolatopsis sp. M39]|nr:hypothetical protein A4R44_01343 [Amycolatopsis sp. M39]
MAPGLREWAGVRFLAERCRAAPATRTLPETTRGVGRLGLTRSSRVKGLARLATRCRRVVGGLGQPTFAERPGMPRRIPRLATIGVGPVRWTGLGVAMA